MTANKSEELLLEARGLFGAGRLLEALPLYRDVLHVHPDHFEALQAIGMIHFRAGQFELAQYFLGEALRKDPTFVDGLRIRGVALMQLRRNATALECFERALRLKPDSTELRLSHATVLLELDRPDEALSCFRALLADEPDNAVAWNNQANALVALRRFEEAVESYNRALALQPDLQDAERNRFLALLELRKVSRIADFAAREAFDNVAETFDAMMDGLNYSSHRHLRALAARLVPPLVPPCLILDVGCGTGLVGQTFKDIAAGGRLDGIDISPKMLGEARKRRIYDDLILGDLETVLAAPGAAYDLILSADTLVYLGDLSPALFGVAKHLKAGGYFLFTCEAMAGDGWQLTRANRFRHSESYLRSEAERAALAVVDVMECTLRREAGEPVPGFAVALRNPRR